MSNSIISRLFAWLLTHKRFFQPFHLFNGDVLQDGRIGFFNNPTAIARAEGNKLWPESFQRNLIVSLGCGVATYPSPYSGNTWVHRIVRSALDVMSGHIQHEHILLIDPQFAVARLDPHLAIEEVDIDDSSSIERLRKELEKEIFRSKALKSKLETTAWRLIASSFVLELERLPYQSRKRYRGRLSRRWQCSGVLKCKQRDEKAFLATLKSREPDLHIQIDGKRFEVDDWKRLTFSVTHENKDIDFILKNASFSAPISGFPCNIRKMLDARQRPTRHRRASRKRKREALR